ncbi:diguanylate cyclase domain-containing protein [Ideonella sp.]|uniref:GGDEF domain-containing protein n=1 Tax=Ideonella sp. TaxID=1929293 RepID=UPI003BB4B0F5
MPPADPSASELQRTLGWNLAFPADMEAQFEADTGQRRARELVWTGLAALLVYNLFLFNDQLNRPETLSTAIFWRLGVVSPYGLLMLALVWRGLTPIWREAAMASTLLVAMLGSGMIFQATTSTATLYDPFTFSLFFLAGQIVYQLRFRVALVYAGLGILLAGFLLLGPGEMPPTAASFAMGLMLATALFTTLAGYRLERAERHAYLLIRRETERSLVAWRAADSMAWLAQTDALTQVANRRAFDLELPKRWAHAAEQDQSMAALMIDIDHFKRFNDRHGHPAGDACLRSVAAVMRANLREGDFLARIGGEEFAVLLAGGSPQAAAAFAERLRLSVQQSGIAASAAATTEAEGVTVSVGLAQMRPQPPQSPVQLLEAADAALYEAKRRGRNCCVMADACGLSPG